jgi:hypothetical protein
VNTARQHLVDEPGIRFGLANALLVMTLLGAAAARLALAATTSLAVLVAGLASVGLPVLMTAWIGLVAWALVTGFVVNQYGELTFQDGDLVRLGVFAVGTLALAVIVHHAYRTGREPPDHRDAAD